MIIEAASIERAYRVRLRPNRAQARVLSRLFGARRFVWNWALERKDAAWRADGTKLSGIDLPREFTALRQAPDTAWLAALPREPFNQTLRDFEAGWRNFFVGRAKRPRRRRFGTVNSARFTLDQRRAGLVGREHGSVQLDGVGRIRFRVTEPLAGRLRSVTVSRDVAGRWFGCFTADGVPAPASTSRRRSISANTSASCAGISGTTSGSAMPQQSVKASIPQSPSRRVRGSRCRDGCGARGSGWEGCTRASLTAGGITSTS